MRLFAGTVPANCTLFARDVKCLKICHVYIYTRISGRYAPFILGPAGSSPGTGGFAPIWGFAPILGLCPYSGALPLF